MLIDRAADSVLELPRVAKRTIAVGLDAALCVIAVYIAFYLRLDQWVVLRGAQWLAIGLSLVLAIPVFIVSGLYREIFRHSGLTALASITQACLVYGVAYAAIITVIQINTIPRTVGIIQPVVLFLFVASSRVVASWWLGGAYAELLGGRSRRAVIIYGAGRAGRQLFRALASSEMRVVGFIDDDPRLHGRTLLGCRINPTVEMQQLIERNQVTDVLLAIPSASRQRRNRILEMIRPLGVAVRTVPGLTEVARGRVQVSEILELDIDDLLGREAVPPDEQLLAQKIRGKVVMVTGAGGSIGSELCRQILSCGPSSLLLLDISEAALYAIHQELERHIREAEQQVRVVPLLGSVCDSGRIRGIMAAWRPDIVYHAAAYKHVPLVEHNAVAGVWNNVFGTLAVAIAARESGVADFVLISTDKAVRPTNIMGASKRLAEQILQALTQVESDTRLSMVRFGNVLGSSGSVVPLFRQQIRAGGPITITHPEITRYFMTIPEAAQLVLQAGSMAKGGEVFVLDMGEPIRILDLARRMVELSGLKVRTMDGGDGDIEFKYVGLRPGEKLYEELLIGNSPVATPHSRIMKATELFIPWPELEPLLETLRETIEAASVDEILSLLRRLVPEYQQKAEVVDWVHRQNERGEQAHGLH